MKAWLVVAVVLVGAGIATFGVWMNGEAGRALMAQAKADAEFVGDAVIRENRTLRNVEASGSGSDRTYMCCWKYPSHAHKNWPYRLYKVTLRVGDNNHRRLILTVYEFPSGVADDCFRNIETLFKAYSGGLEVVKEEQFTDDGATGTLTSYVSYSRSDGKSFVTPNERDIGERAGVVATCQGGDEHWKSYVDLLAEARSQLKK